MLNKNKILTAFSLFISSLVMGQVTPTSAGTPVKAVADKIVAVVGDRRHSKRIRRARGALAFEDEC